MHAIIISAIGLSILLWLLSLCELLRELDLAGEAQLLRRLRLMLALAVLLGLLFGVPILFAGEPKAEPKAEQFDRLVSDLGHSSFRVRERAQHQLSRLGFSAVPRREAAARGSTDPEIRRRLDVVIVDLAAERRRWAERTVRDLYGDCLPMIDAWWLDTSAACYDHSGGTWQRRLALRRLKGYLDAAWGGVAGGDMRRWAAYRDATRAWFVDMVEMGVPVPVVSLIYLEMRRRDNLWIARQVKQEMDPWTMPGLMPPPACPLWPPAQPDDPPLN